MENSSSPLQKYKRKPKLFIDLPSQGQYYNRNLLPKAEELEVYSMTANDEILIKTPDALLTGNATVQIIQNCMPDIKDAWSVTSRDLDYILTAIRIATYGDSIEMTHTCPKCSNQDKFVFPLQPLLDHIASAQPIYEFKVKDFIIRIRPLSYKEVVASQQQTLKIRRTLTQEVPKIEDAEQRTAEINKLYDQTNDHTKNLLCSIVTEIITPDGDSETNPVFIKNFLLESEGDWYTALQETYAENNEKISVPKTQVECTECSHSSSVRPNLDYTSFFLRE